MQVRNNSFLPRGKLVEVDEEQERGGGRVHTWHINLHGGGGWLNYVYVAHNKSTKDTALLGSDYVSGDVCVTINIPQSHCSLHYAPIYTAAESLVTTCPIYNNWPQPRLADTS